MPIEYQVDEMDNIGEVIDGYESGFHLGRRQQSREGGWNRTMRSSFGDAILIQPWPGVIQTEEQAKTALGSAWQRFLDLAGLVEQPSAPNETSSQN